MKSLTGVRLTRGRFYVVSGRFFFGLSRITSRHKLQKWVELSDQAAPGRFRDDPIMARQNETLSRIELFRSLNPDAIKRLDTRCIAARPRQGMDH